ncbi:(2Fe-2S)-binding protein [soil metagenome]
MVPIVHGARRLQENVSDRERRLVQFTFDGLPMEGFDSEPVAVALLASGVRVFRTMPETGEQRGGFCFGGRCADCLMVIDGQSGVRACLAPVRAGMDVRTQVGVSQAPAETNT